MICDIHCHILPGVDDGARNEASTKRMLKIASKEGINIIVATPHFTLETSEEDIYIIKEKYNKVREWWRAISPKNEMYLGNELFYTEGLIESLRRGNALTMNDTKYVLIEFPIYIDFRSIERAVQSLLYAGYVPILAHIERYESLRKKDRIKELIKIGAYMQVNASSILGHQGLRIKLYVMRLLKESLIHFIGTDAHSSKERRPEMKRCKEYLEKKIGVKKINRILEKNTAKMLTGEKLNG